MSSKMWEDELTCEPLNTLDEIEMFLEFPPPWRTLCKGLTPHSKSLVRNRDISNHYGCDTSLDSPETFCHFDPDIEDVNRHDETTLPKTLVCHDMANGYHDDCYIDGTANHEAYTFYNWAGIDIFCYFSHHLVTIPPLSWINVGHAHGVKVIGTLITEWAEGVEFWDKVLQTEESFHHLARCLVTIANTLKFDGWLLNVENKIAKPQFLLEFVKYLNRILHEDIPHAVLIWYDSVTTTGSLNWQNGLNEKNKEFFDACDGLFTNYSWSENDVEDSVIEAGDRVTDLYIGIDVWGRNFYGGGQFNTQEAVKFAHQLGCSLAIFAPAWTHEALSMEKCDINAVAMAEGLDKCQQFVLRDRALWGSLWPFLNTRVPCELPFKTSFCRGQGKKRRMYGEVLCNTPWFNLRHQQYQPNSAHGPHGYLLTTLEEVLQGARYTYKDGNGILRYRHSFQAHRQELHSVKSSMRASEGNLQVSKSNMRVSEDGGQPAPRAASDPDVADQEEVPPTSHKFKNYFKNLLHIKTEDRHEEVEEAEEGPESRDRLVAGPSQPALRSSGKSMQQMSVSLRLGERRTVRRFALAYVAEELECLEVFQDDSFHGGSCLRIHPWDTFSTERRVTRLFHCDFYCEDSLVVCVVTKEVAGFREQSLNLKLAMRNARGEALMVVLLGRCLPSLRAVTPLSTGVCSVPPLDTHDDRFRQLQKYLLLNEPTFYVPVENSFHWSVRYYELRLPGVRVTSVSCRTALDQGAILLGHLGICHLIQERPAATQLLPKVIEVHGADTTEKT